MVEQLPVSGWGIHTLLTRVQSEEFRQAGIEPLHAQLLYNRGITTGEAMKRFLAASFDELLDPFSLKDMQPACTRIMDALDHGEHITVFGDFDADGVTSAALLTRALRKLKQPGTVLDHFIPHRINDLRGLSNEALDTIRDKGTTLLITTDCGSSDADAIAYANSRGIDVIVTDHHHPPEQLRPDFLLINPWREDFLYPERYLCGAGIAFKLAQALFKHYEREDEARELLDLVAIGTIGDVALLLGENHTLAQLGLQQLNATTNAGLRALMQLVALRPGQVRERDISYVLGPRINAAGRMQHADIAFELLTTGDEEKAKALAVKLEELNQSRQQITEDLMKLVREQAQSQQDQPVILVYGDKSTWPEGIIGLVAGRLSEELRRPVFVLSQDDASATSRGSARSQDDFNIIEALRSRADLFERHGGHAQAAGFTIANDNIGELRQHLIAWKGAGNGNAPVSSEEQSAPVPDGGEPNGTAIEQEEAETGRKVDLLMQKPETQLTYDTYLKVSRLSPFGAGNPEPTFRLDGVQLLWRATGGRDNRNMRVSLQIQNKRFTGLFIRGGTRIGDFPEGARVNIIFCLDPAWSPPGSEQQDIRLRILAMETKP